MIPRYPFGNHIGEQFGHLLAVGVIESDAETGDPVIYDCKCMKCGKEHIHVLDRDLLFYKVRSCGCCNPHDLTGMKFGRLTVIQRVSNGIHRESRYLCRCSCDKHSEIVVRSNSLLTLHKRSCGCLLSEKSRERVIEMNKTKEHQLQIQALGRSEETRRRTSVLMRSDVGKLILERLHRKLTKWTDEDRKILSHLKAMKYRCYNPDGRFYYRYGGRGIRVCDEWMDGERGKRSFIAWAKSHGFKSGLSIDRIDNNGPYSPENCRWTTQQEQCNNMSSNRWIDVDDTRHTAAEWSRISGISKSTIYHCKDLEHTVSLIRNRLENRSTYAM